MCDPVSGLMIASAVVSAAGTAYGGLAANAQGKYAAKVAEKNAAEATEQSRDAKVEGQIAQERLDRQYGQTKGAQIAAMAANGVDLSYGSAEQVQQDTAMYHYEDKAALDRNTYQTMRGYAINAANYKSQGQAEKMAGKAKMVGSFLSAGGSILGDAAQFGKMRAGA